MAQKDYCTPRRKLQHLTQEKRAQIGISKLHFMVIYAVLFIT